MLIIVGSALLAEPWILAEHWHEKDVRALTPADLSKPGWRYRPWCPDDTTIVVDGVELPEKIVAGVVTTLPCVSRHDLPHILEHDRDYVAAEMTAFLLAWLSELRCPVIERPSPSSLTGSGLRDWQWIALARGLGIRASAPNTGERDNIVDVTVLAGHAIGAPTPVHARAAERLADSAARNLVTLTFARGTPELIAVKHVPAVDSAAVAQALLAWLER